MKSALIKKLAVVFTVVAAVVSYATSQSQAASIGLNITYNGTGNTANTTDPSTIMAATDTTGVVSQAHWNTITSGDWYTGPDAFYLPVLSIDSTKEGHPTFGTLVDSTGAATSVNVKSDKGLNWFTSSNAAYAGSTAAEELLYGFAQANGGDAPVTININGLSNIKYDIYAYFATNADSNTVAILGGTSYYFNVPTGQASSFTQATNTTAGVFTQNGNYVEWAGVLPGSGTISFLYGGPGGAQGAGLAGLQIVEAPEPASLGILMLGAGALMRRRRRAAR